MKDPNEKHTPDLFDELQNMNEVLGEDTPERPENLWPSEESEGG